MANGWGNIEYKTFSEEMGPWFERQQQSQRAQGNNDEDRPQPPSMDQIFSMADQIYQSNPLNEVEQQELSDMTDRAQRLQPLSQEQQYGSGRIAGNPYSVDASGAITGAANLAKGGINRVRRNRRQEFADDYENLAGREEQAQQAREGRQEFLGEMVPEAFGEAQQNYRTRVKEQGRSDRIDQEYNRKEDLAEFKAEIDEDYGGLSQAPPSIVTEYLDLRTQKSELDKIGLERLLDERQSIKDNNIMSEEEKGQALGSINPSIDKKYNQIIQQAEETAKLVEDMGYVPRQEREEESEEESSARFDPPSN